jgi:8-oxo-dGTP diphosphatase
MAKTRLAHEAQDIKLTVDIILFKMIRGRLSLLLVKRKYPPFQGQWAIPGGFIGAPETRVGAAMRELEEETGLKDTYIEQLYTFGDPGRDPRGQVVTVAYLGLIPADAPVRTRAGSDAAEAEWFALEELPPLAFDHAKIAAYARERLINKLEYTTAGFALLARDFALSDLQQVYEAVLGRPLDKRNFRRKLELLDILKATGSFRSEGAQRPAQLYQLSTKKFEKLKNKGILFPF